MAPAWSWADSVATHGWHHAVLTGIHFSGPFLKLHERRDLKQKPSHTQHVLPTTRLGPPVTLHLGWPLGLCGCARACSCVTDHCRFLGTQQSKELED